MKLARNVSSVTNERWGVSYTTGDGINGARLATGASVVALNETSAARFGLRPAGPANPQMAFRFPSPRA